MEKKILSLPEFRAKYLANEDACLDEVFGGKSGDARHCPRCDSQQKFYRVRGRKCYKCGKCGQTLFPLKGTAMENTKVPLTNWFCALLDIASAKAGISALELSEKLGVGYKDSWRMCQRIRDRMGETAGPKLKGVIEIDETFIGGRQRQGRKYRPQVAVLGLFERGGRVRSFVLPDMKKDGIFQLIRENVEKGSTIYTDEHSRYTKLAREGYTHESVCHKDKEWARGNVTTNRIEGHWRQVKAMVRTHVSLSRKHLQGYLHFRDFLSSRRGMERSEILHDLLQAVISRQGYQS